MIIILLLYYYQMNNENLKVNKDYASIFEFKTQNSSDIPISLLKKAFETIDRKKSLIELDKYINDIAISHKIEEGLFEFALVYCVSNNDISENLVGSIYMDKLHDICSNLDPTDIKINNITLKDTITNKSFDPYYTAFLSPEQMNPHKWSSIIEKHKIIDDTITNVNTTDIYTCKRCKSKKFKISTLQIRSSDEPASNFITCMVCYFTFIM